MDDQTDASTVDRSSDSTRPASGRDRIRIGGLGSHTAREVFRGLIGGLIASVLMSLYRFPLFRALPPTSEFWATYIGEEEPEEYFRVGLVLHLLYGTAAGGVFGLGFSLLDFRTERDRRFGAIALSLGYGLVLSLFGTRVVFERLLDEELEPDEAAVFHVGHVIYGLTVGTWLSSREESGDVYE